MGGVVLLLGGARRLACPQQGSVSLDSNRLAPFVPTPQSVVEKMLKIAQVGPNDLVYDLGSGDGRFVITAAEKFGAQGVGVEVDDKLVRESSERIATLGLAQRAKIISGDMFQTNLRPATVVTLYQLTIINERLRDLLERDLRPGARVVSNDYRIPGWKPRKVVRLKSEAGVGYKIYLYVRP
jgi:predicted RNA methylase